jgi:glycosyltransferase involved in cell wall biosynthesis
VALRSAIARLWNDPEECRRLGAAGRRLAESGHGQDQWRATLCQAVTEAVSSRGDDGALRRSAATAPPRRGAEIDELTSLVFTSRQQKPPDAELRRRISAGELPDTVSAEDMIGATVVDERYFEAMPGLRGRLLRRFPLLAAQAVELAFVGHRYDAIVAWGERHAAVLAAVLRLRRSRPGMVAILIWPSKSKRAARFVRMVRRELDRVIVPSPMQRRFAQERLGIPPRRFVEARYAVDTRFWRPQERDGDIICSAGQEMRDYGTLLEALRGLEIPCHIAAGQGLFDARFLTRDWDRNVGDRSIPSNVTVGRLPHAELRELYARSRFVVVPILPSDNDSGITVILEAFAMGKAVICTQSPGQTGLLEPDVNCLRVPPEDPDALRAAILELWEDPDRCNRLGAAGRAAVVERHGLDQWRAALMRAVAGAAPRNS